MASSKKIAMIPYRAYSQNKNDDMYKRGALNIKHFSGINDNAFVPSYHDKPHNSEEARKQYVGFNFKEKGTDRKNGTNSIPDSWQTSMSYNTREELKVIGNVRNIFSSNTNAYGCSMVNNVNHEGMFLALGCDKKLEFKNPDQAADYQRCGHHQTQSTLLQDVIGVSFSFNYHGSHSGAKDVHPYILEGYMVYGVNVDSSSSSEQDMYLFARKIVVDFGSGMYRDVDSKDQINSKVFNYSGRISDADISSMKNDGLFGNKSNTTASYGKQRVAYWMGLAWKLKFPKKNTSQVTRTIHFHDVRPIVSDSTDMSTSRVNDWVIPCDPRANPDNNTHRYNRRHQFLFV